MEVWASRSLHAVGPVVPSPTLRPHLAHAAQPAQIPARMAAVTGTAMAIHSASANANPVHPANTPLLPTLTFPRRAIPHWALATGSSRAGRARSPGEGRAMLLVERALGIGQDPERTMRGVMIQASRDLRGM